MGGNVGQAHGPWCRVAALFKSRMQRPATNWSIVVDDSCAVSWWGCCSTSIRRACCSAERRVVGSCIRIARVRGLGPWAGDTQKAEPHSRLGHWIFTYSIVTARNGDEAAEAKFAEYLKALYAQYPPDLIITLAAPAGRSVQRYRAHLFPATPMLLAAVSPRRVDPSILTDQDAIAGVQFDQSFSRRYSASVTGDKDHRADQRETHLTSAL